MFDHRINFTHKSGNGRAVVIGGGIAGLLAARVLADHFEKVLLLERDKYPDSPGLRSGAPQAKHVHLLLLRGKEILENFFPGLSKELITLGAETVKMGPELGVLTYYGWRVKHPGGLKLLAFTQPLFEWCIRRRLANITAVKTMEGCRVTGLVAGKDGNSVKGVRVHFSREPNQEKRVYGQLVVDTSGRFSRTPDWLSELGYREPDETVVDPYLGYASRFYEKPEEFVSGSPGSEEWKALLILGKPPDQTRGGVLLPVENDRWHVTLVGVGGDYPPNDEAGFLEFAGTLRSGIIYDLISDARPLSPVTGYRSTKNRRRHYEKLSRWPKGFIVMGDALCAFNPVYAQGMTVAAQQAIVLEQCLDKNPQNSFHEENMARNFQREVVQAIETPWMMAVTDDVRWPETEGGNSGFPEHLKHLYLDAVIALATESPEIDELFAQVAHLVEPVDKLFHPRVALRAVGRLINPFN